jgi:hypothetical protein
MSKLSKIRKDRDLSEGKNIILLFVYLYLELNYMSIYC